MRMKVIKFSMLRMFNKIQFASHMIKNRTLEFKQKYSSSELKNQPSRKVTPEYVKKKFQTTGFTDFSISTSAKQSSTRKLAKVESTAFINSRKKLNNFSINGDTLTLKNVDNMTSICNHLPNIDKKIEKTPIHRYRMTPNEDAVSEIATIESPKQTPYKSQKTQKHQILINSIPDLNKFFNSLTPRTLFFCSKCLKYIFAIQKNLHYPKCQNQVNLIEISSKQAQEIGWQRLQLLKQLSEYTNFKHREIVELFERVKRKQLSEEIIVDMGVQYLAFDRLIQAFYFVYYLFFSSQRFKKSSYFSMKKIFSCTQPNQTSSWFNEKNYFG